MDRRKIENIIIIILVLLNLFLLAVVISDRAQADRSSRETAKTVTALLKDGGISVSPDAKLLQSVPAVCSLTRDFTHEAEQMAALFGSSGVEDLGGSIRFYRSDRGQAILRGTGEMDLLLTGGSVPLKGGREKTAEKFLERAGVATGLWHDLPEEERAECCCLWDGMPVFNARLACDFSGDNLFMVTGTLLFSKETERSTEDVMDAVSVLIRFVEIVRSEGFICSRLDALTPGYLVNVTVSGESSLTPVWHIETDTGELFINAITGKTETVS